MSEQLGLGVMIARLTADPDTAVAVAKSIGQVIRKVTVAHKDEDYNVRQEVRIEFANDTTMCLWDDGQSCCEHRYLTCDDDLGRFVGAELRELIEREMSCADEDGEYHEQGCLLIRTSYGDITVVTHNEHNGYYGGFALRAQMEAS